MADDRRWMVVDASGRFMTQRDHPAMARITAVPTALGLRLTAADRALDVPTPGPGAERVDVTVWRDTVPALLAGDAAAALLGAAIGVACRLAWMDDPRVRPTDPDHAPPGSTVSFADGFPLLLTTDASLAALNTRLAPHPVTAARFRPNVVVAGSTAWDEDRWHRIRIGAVAFTVAKPCERCLVTTIDPETGERPDRREPLRTLGRMRRAAGGGVLFGQNLVPEMEGTIAVSDPVVVLEAGAPRVEILPERP